MGMISFLGENDILLADRRMSFAFVLFSVVFKAVGKHKVSLTEIVQQGIHDDTYCHLAVCGDHGTASEGEEAVDLLVIQQELCDHGSYKVIGYTVANQHFQSETSILLGTGSETGEDQKFASQEPENTSQTIIEQRCNMLIDTAGIKEEKHKPGAEYEIGEPDDHIEDQGAIQHSFDSFHSISVEK